MSAAETMQKLPETSEADIRRLVDICFMLPKANDGGAPY